MCFSSEASFTASAVLAVIGIVTVKKVNHPSQLAFASIPFLFSLQQLTEGIVWVSLSHKELAFLQSTSTYLFLIIAQIVWPTWVPLSILMLEKNEKRKNALRLILGIGLGLSLYLTFCYLFYEVNAEISMAGRIVLFYPNRSFYVCFQREENAFIRDIYFIILCNYVTIYYQVFSFNLVLFCCNIKYARSFGSCKLGNC